MAAPARVVWWPEKCSLCGGAYNRAGGHVCPGVDGKPKPESVTWPCADCGGRITDGNRLLCEPCVEAAYVLAEARQDGLRSAVESIRAWVKRMQG